MKLVPDDLTTWIEFARRDEWHSRFVGSDIRCMLGEIERLRAECASLREANNTWVASHGPAPAMNAEHQKWNDGIEG